jgi:membrane protein
MLATTWKLVKESVNGFIEDDALSRGAAMAFYAVTSLAPILLIVVAIAGLVFGEKAAEDAIADQLRGLVGQQSAEMLQNAIKSASGKSSGVLATAIGVVTLVVTASGVFGEMQTALNAIWKAKPVGGTVSRLIRARAASLGLVAALGFLLMVSLVMSAAISALGDVIDAWLPSGKIILHLVNIVVSYLLISVLFAAIYKVLPDRHLRWGDVVVGALVTAALFTLGKTLIGIYLGSTAATSTYGAAGALLIVLLWVYYSSEIFLLGSEFTRAWSLRHGNIPEAVAPGRPPASRKAVANAPLSAMAGSGTSARSRAVSVSESPVLTAIATTAVMIAFLREWRRR